MSRAQPFLVLDHVRKSFGAHEVIADATVSLERGESLALVGPSGAGKTVLLRLIAGIAAPDGGRILLDGRDLAGMPSAERGIGLAFQNFALYPHLTAYDNIASPLRARGLADAEGKRRVGEVADLLRIGHVLSQEPRRLSNGQKQRTALARSLVSGATLQMLDDPLRNVDAKLRYEMRFELPRLLKTFGATSIYVTQDYREAMAFGDRIAVLDGGRFLQVGDAQAVYAKPATLSVARLFGDPTLNTFAVTPAADGGVSLFERKIALPGRGLGAFAGQPCTLGVRPEHVAVATEPGPGRMRMELDAVTPLNDRAALLLRTPAGEEVLALLSEDAIGRMPAHHGTVHVSIDPARVLAFDPSGQLQAA